MRIYQIPRNDLDACMAYHDRHQGVTPDEAHVMYLLQDDTEAFKALTLSPRWIIKAATAT